MHPVLISASIEHQGTITGPALWLAGLAELPPEAQTRAAPFLGRAWAGHDPAAALQWTSKLNDSGQRHEIFREISAQWMRRRPARSRSSRLEFSTSPCRKARGFAETAEEISIAFFNSFPLVGYESDQTANSFPDGSVK